MRWLVLSNLAALAIVAASCGGGGADESATPESTSQPKPSQPIAAAMGAFDKAIAADSCKEYQPLVFSLIRQRPAGSAATHSECPAGTGVPSNLRGQRFDSSREYGTGAIIEGPLPAGNSGRKEISIWVLDGDRRYRSINFYGALDPQIGTSGSLASAPGVAQRFVAATRAKDCAAMEPLLSAKGRLVVSNGSTSAACKVVLGGMFFAPAVQEGPAPKAELTGGSRDFAFVGIPTGESYFTVVVSDAGGDGPQVLDVMPNTPVKFPPTRG